MVTESIILMVILLFIIPAAVYVGKSLADNVSKMENDLEEIKRVLKEKEGE